MASEEAMRATYERRMRRFPPREHANTAAWWTPVMDYITENSPHVVTIARSDGERFPDGIPLSQEQRDWLHDNIGCEGMENYNDSRRGPFNWCVGAWDWLWTPHMDKTMVDMLFIDQSDAAAFKLRFG